MKRLSVLVVVSAALGGLARAAVEAPEKPDQTLSGVYGGMEYRLIGPFRGGRVDAVAGVRGQPLVY
ncbi:MAG TPA: hypothetical protein VIB08_08115, partial [Thermoanaerobaculia bacterium]